MLCTKIQAVTIYIEVQLNIKFYKISHISKHGSMPQNLFHIRQMHTQRETDLYFLNTVLVQNTRKRVNPVKAGSRKSS